jgi:hypothetical protein
MKPKEIAQTILEEQVAYSISLWRTCLYLITVILWLLLAGMWWINQSYYIFAIWQVVSIAVFCVYLSIVSYVMGHNRRLLEILRRKLEFRLRMKFHWFF